MIKYVAAYLASGAMLLVLDVAWLHFVMRDIFRSTVGNAALTEVRMLPAALFYAGFVAALIYFAVIPAVDASSMMTAVGCGALLGLLAYGSYDLTNMATLKPWRWSLVLLDLSWGTLVSGLSALMGFAAWNTLVLARSG